MADFCDSKVFIYFNRLSKTAKNNEKYSSKLCFVPLSELQLLLHNIHTLSELSNKLVIRRTKKFFFGLAPILHFAQNRQSDINHAVPGLKIQAIYHTNCLQREFGGRCGILFICPSKKVHPCCQGMQSVRIRSI